MLPIDLAKQEIIEAIGEVMAKYNLTMDFTTEHLWDGNEDRVIVTIYYLQQAFDELWMNDICEALLPIEYGKAKE